MVGRFVRELTIRQLRALAGLSQLPPAALEFDPKLLSPRPRRFDRVQAGVHGRLSKRMGRTK